MVNSVRKPDKLSPSDIKVDACVSPLRSTLSTTGQWRHQLPEPVRLSQPPWRHVPTQRNIYFISKLICSFSAVNVGRRHALVYHTWLQQFFLWYGILIIIFSLLTEDHSLSHIGNDCIALFPGFTFPLLWDWQTTPQTRDRRTNHSMHLKQKHLQGFPLLFSKSVLRKVSSREFHQLRAFPAGNCSFCLEQLFCSPGCSGISL